MSARRHVTAVFLTVLAVSGGWLALGSAPALATLSYGFTGSFGKGVDKTPPGGNVCTVASGEECGPGEAGSGTGQFTEPAGVAVNDTMHDVYVVDRGDNRVEEFNAEGTFIVAFNGSGTPGELSKPEEIAVDNSGLTTSEDPSVGDVYVTDHNVVDKFSATGEYKGQITEAEGTAFGTLDGVAVDPEGVVWVYQENAFIDAFSDAATNAFLSPQRQSPFGTEPGFAVDSEDDLYVNRGSDQFAKLNSLGENLIEELEDQEGDSRAAAVDLASNELYILTASHNIMSPSYKLGTSVLVFGANGSFYKRIELRRPGRRSPRWRYRG